VRLYKELSEVERAISNIKDAIEMRPIIGILSPQRRRSRP